MLALPALGAISCAPYRLRMPPRARCALSGGSRGRSYPPFYDENPFGIYQKILAGKAKPPVPPRTKWTRRVPHPVLIGHAASLTPYPPPPSRADAL